MPFSWYGVKVYGKLIYSVIRSIHPNKMRNLYTCRGLRRITINGGPNIGEFAHSKLNSSYAIILHIFYRGLSQQPAYQVQQIGIVAGVRKTGDHFPQDLKFGIFGGFHSRRSFQLLGGVYGGIVIKQKWNFNAQVWKLGSQI